MRKLRSLAVCAACVCALSVTVALQPDRSATEGPPPHADGLIEPLRSPDGWWKGNLHTHSLWSDGDDFPEMIADWFKRQDYHFLTLSDHNVLSEGQRWIKARTGTFPEALQKYRVRFGANWVETRGAGDELEVRLKPLDEFRSLLEEPGRFLMIQGEEITHSFARKPVHLNGINLRDLIPPVDGGSVAETILVNRRAVAEQSRRTGRPMLTFLNHPNFGWGVSVEDLIDAEELAYFEVYNGHPAVGNYGDDQRPSTERMWDVALAHRLGKRDLPVLYGVATDDSHRYHRWGVGQVNPGRGWVMVRAPYLSAEAIVRAMLAGDFYLSTGVTLDELSFRDGRLSVGVRPEAGVNYTVHFVATMRDTPLEKGEAGYDPEIGQVVAEVAGPSGEYVLTGEELYVRAKVISDKPHPNPYEAGDVELAWTQPYTP